MLERLFGKKETLAARAQRVVALTAERKPDGGRLWGELQALCQDASKASPQARDDVLSVLSAAMGHSHPQVSGMVALAGGAIVESGGSAGLWGKPLLARLPEVLQAAERFVQAVEPQLPESGEGDHEEEGVYVCGVRVPDELVEQIASRDGESVAAYQSLGVWTMPAIAVLTRERTFRELVRTDEPLVERIESLCQAEDGMMLLHQVVQVLDDEPLLVLCPKEGKGFRCRIHQIGVNFELHTLLLDALCRPEYGLSGERPHPDAVAATCGEGGRGEPTVHGQWNLYDWQGAALPLEGDEPQMSHWVWNEGAPADIPLFDDLRVVLLGPASYARSWNAGRLFDALRPSLTVEGVLTAGEVSEWLARMRATARSLGAA